MNYLKRTELQYLCHIIMIHGIIIIHGIIVQQEGLVFLTYGLFVQFAGLLGHSISSVPIEK